MSRGIGGWASEETREEWLQAKKWRVVLVRK